LSRPVFENFQGKSSGNPLLDPGGGGNDIKYKNKRMSRKF
jgi:hypothetical protein